MTDNVELGKNIEGAPIPRALPSIKISEKNGLIRTLTTLENEVHELRKAIREEGTSSATTTASATATASDDPCWDGYRQVGMKKGKGGKMVPNCVPVDAANAFELDTITADVGGYGGECPPATQDIQLNLANRQNAIDNVGYGPLNPAEPNEEFWQDKADRWNIEIPDAKTALCGNCIFFVRTPKMLDCIEEGIGLGSQEAEGSIEAGELGYCNALDFKCASERTCNAWAAGGPITEDSDEDTATVVAAAKKRTKAQTPAPKKDQIKGSSKNPKGSAAGGKKITFSKAVEKSLEGKVAEHNKTASKGRRATLSMLKAVYRRGAGAFSTSHRPGQNRNSWSMARVNAFLRLLKSGKPSKSAYTQDNDLLPSSHPRSTKKKAANSPVTASALIPEERDLAEAIYEVVQKHGKFDQDGDGVWAGYTPAAENEVASIGVKCSNCVFYQGGDQCAIISLDVEPEGKCRFAMLPEGAVKGYDIPLRDPNSLELLLASAYADSQLMVDLPEQNTFETVDEAVLAATEYSDLGYETEPAFRASWLRAVKNGEEPYKRLKMLATLKYDSLDSDLLPREGSTDE
jgi:hypothetical protein